MVGVKFLNMVVVRLQVSEKFVICICIGIIFVSVMIIVLLQMLYMNESQSSMSSMWVNDGVCVRNDSVGQVVVMVSIVMLISSGWWLIWLDSVLLIGSYMKFDMLMQSVMSRLLVVFRCSIVLLKVGVQMVIRQKFVVVIVISIMLVIMMFQFWISVLNIFFMFG